MKVVNFNNSTTTTKTYFISNCQDYLKFLFKKEGILKVLFYPKDKDLGLDWYNTSDFVVLHENQKMEENIIITKFKYQKLILTRKNILEYLGIDFYFDNEIINLSKNNNFFKGIYIFLKLANKYSLNPEWIKNFNGDNSMFWSAFVFLDDDRIIEDFNILKTYSKKVDYLDVRIIFELLYSELTGDFNLCYDFYLKCEFKDQNNITENELKEFDIEQLKSQGIIYEPCIGRYEIIK